MELYEPPQSLEGEILNSDQCDLPETYLTKKDMIDICRKAKMKVYSQLAETYYRAKFYETGVIDIRDDAIPEMTKILNAEFDRNSKKPPYLFVTINPKPNISLETLQKVVKKILKKADLIRSFYVYEVRKSDFSGLHFHMALEYKGRNSKFISGVKSTCHHICDVNNTHCFNVKFMTLDVLLTKIEYMKGSKKDSKKSGVEASIAYREANYLEPFYQTGIPFSL